MRNDSDKMSRRALLTTLAVAGATVVAGGLTRSVSGEATVSDAVYGNKKDKEAKHSPDAHDVRYRYGDELPERSLSDKLHEIVSVKDFGAKGDGTADDTAAVQAALQLAKSQPVIIIVPPGVYLLTAPLKIYRNTVLKMTLATFVRGHRGAFLYNGDAGEMYEGYNGHGNITIEGGIFDGNLAAFPSGFNAINLARGSRITFSNVEIRDTAGGHAVDMNACEHVRFERCRFVGYKPTSSTTREAIQISNQTADSFGSDTNGFGAVDGTPCRNVRIIDCYFGASGTPGTQAWTAGVGHHSAVHNVWNRNVTVSGSLFEGMTYAAIRMFKFSDVLLSGNTFLNCSRGVKLDSAWGGTSLANQDASGAYSKMPQAGKNIHIENNLFINTANECIAVTGAAFGTIAAYYDNLHITGNTFDNTDIASPSGNSNVIYLAWARQVKIDGNSMIKGYRGIHASYVTELFIGDGNTIADMVSEGVHVSEPDVSFNYPQAGEPGYDASLHSANAASWYRNKGYTANVQIGRSRVTRTVRTGIYLNYVWGFRINGAMVDTACTATDMDRDAIRIDNYSKDGEITFPIVRKNTAYVSGTGGANRYAVNVLGTCRNVRLLAGELEGKANVPVALAGTNVWNGYYAYAPDGTRFKATVSNEGAAVYTEG